MSFENKADALLFNFRAEMHCIAIYERIAQLLLQPDR